MVIKDKLEAVEARLETKLAGIDAKIDRLVDAVANSRAELVEVRKDNKNTRWTIIVTVIVSLLAAGGALWTTQNNMLAAFSAGLTLRSEPAPAQRQHTANRRCQTNDSARCD